MKKNIKSDAFMIYCELKEIYLVTLQGEGQLQFATPQKIPVGTCFNTLSNIKARLVALVKEHATAKDKY